MSTYYLISSDVVNDAWGLFVVTSTDEWRTDPEDLAPGEHPEYGISETIIIRRMPLPMMDEDETDTGTMATYANELLKTAERFGYNVSYYKESTAFTDNDQQKFLAQLRYNYSALTQALDYTATVVRRVLCSDRNDHDTQAWGESLCARLREAHAEMDKTFPPDMRNSFDPEVYFGF